MFNTRNPSEDQIKSVRIDINYHQMNKKTNGSPMHPVYGINETQTNRLFAEERISSHASSSSSSSSNGYASYYGSLSFNPSITFRPLLPSDYIELKEMHESLFPIKYEEEFYKSVVYGRGIISWAAIDASDSDRLIGFVTAKIMKSHEIQDCSILGFEWNSKIRTLIYILTLGVIPSHRKLRIASSLITRVKDFAASCHDCRGIYLHVIDYNKEAISFYQSNEFKCLHRLSPFYLIDNIHYDAFLYVFYVNGGYSPLDIFEFASVSFWKCLCSLPYRLLKQFKIICPIDIKNNNSNIINNDINNNNGSFENKKMDDTNIYAMNNSNSPFSYLFGVKSYQ